MGSTGDYWLFSPIQPNTTLIEQIKQQIAAEEAETNHKCTIYIVYGNSLHHIYAEDWMNSFPNNTTKLCGPKELITKMEEMKRDELKFDFEINNDEGTKTVLPWQKDVDHFL